MSTSSVSSVVQPGLKKHSSSLMVLEPPGPTTLAVAFRHNKGGEHSEEGEALQTFPPMVATLRMPTDPIRLAAVARSGKSSLMIVD